MFHFWTASFYDDNRKYWVRAALLWIWLRTELNDDITVHSAALCSVFMWHLKYFHFIQSCEFRLLLITVWMSAVLVCRIFSHPLRLEYRLSGFECVWSFPLHFSHCLLTFSFILWIHVQISCSVFRAVVEAQSEYFSTVNKEYVSSRCYLQSTFLQSLSI